MKNFLRLCLLILVSASCHDEENIKVSSESLSYFPLAVGNTWEYEPIRSDVPFHHKVLFTIVGKEVYGGHEYFVMQRSYNFDADQPSVDTVHYRLDSNGIVFEVSKYYTGEIQRFRLGAKDGEGWTIPTLQPQYDYHAAVHQEDVTGNGQIFKNSKVFTYDVPEWADEEHYMILAEGIGIIEHGNAWGFNYRLRRAIINGVAF